MNLPLIDAEATGKNISRLRKENNLSVHELASILNFNTGNAIYKWQNGVSLPTLDNLVILASIFHVSIDDIIIVRGGITNEE